MIRNHQIFNGKTAIIFGTGNAAKRVYDDLNSSSIHVFCCVDNDCNKWGYKFQDLDIKSPEILREIDKENTLIVISSMYFEEISKQLDDMGFIENLHYIKYLDLYVLPLHRKFEQIISKYHFIKKNFSVSVFEEYILHNIKSVNHNQKIAIWGAGEHTQKLIELYDERPPILFLVDEDNEKVGSQLEGFLIKPITALNEEGIQVVILSCIERRKEVKSLINQEYPWIKVIDFYELYDKLFPHDDLIPFYDKTYNHYKYNLDIHILRHLIQEETETNRKSELYLSLISLFLHIKDFAQFQRVVLEYARMNFVYSDQLIELSRELKLLMIETEEAISSRKHNDIFFFIFDSMREKDIDYCSFISSLSAQSISFKMAYSPSTYTRASLNGMLTGVGKDGQDYNVKEIDGSQSQFLSWLSNNNYAKFQHGAPYIHNNQGSEFVEILDRFNQSLPFPARWWEVMARLTAYDIPQFHFIHVLETHSPFICPEHTAQVSTRYTPLNFYTKNNDSHEDSETQYREVLLYIDQTMRNICSYLPKDSVLILCSDHGGGVGGNIPTGHVFTCYEDAIHVPLIIRHPQVEATEIKELFSLTRLDPLLVGVLNDKTIDTNLLSSHVLVSRGPVYRSSWFNHPVLPGRAGVWMKAFRMVRTNEFKYILFEDGSEILLRVTDESINVINNPALSEVLRQLRSIIPTDFIQQT